jgi:DNA (cytosine-5)-methyltransferase 1
LETHLNTLSHFWGPQYPDDFIFAGSKESVRKQIGMAVPCFGAEVIFESILKCFAGLTYPHIAPNIEPLIYPSHLELYNRKATGQMRICEEGVEYKSE